MSENITIPNGWKSIKLGNVLKIETGSKNAEDSSLDGIYPFFTRAEETQKIDTYSYDTEALFIAGEGNFRVKYYKGKFEAHQRTYVLTPKNEDIDLSYLQKAIQPKITRLISTSVGSTVMSLRKPQIAEIDVLAPKLKEEQLKIAEILNEVDNAISKTEELFEKNKRIKTALMQNLLSYGIDENGKNRHPLTHRFKPSELGDIPIEWDVKKLKNITNKIIDGTHYTPKYITYGIPFLRVTDIQSTTIDFNNIKYISEKENIQLSKRCKPEKNDILYSKNGTIGIPKIINWDFHFNIFVSLCLIKPIHKKINSQFLSFILESDLINKQIRFRSKQMSVNNLHLEEIKEFDIPVPKNIYEQQRIAQILSSQDEKNEAIKIKLAKLKSLKASLMQDLLSGRKRVTKLMEENS